MATREKAEAERLKEQDENVKRALEQTGGKALKPEEAKREEAARPPSTRRRHKLWIGTYFFALLALAALQYAVRLKFFDFAGDYRQTAQRAIVAAMSVVVVL